MNAPAAPLSLALLGHPNSGKTALFNLLTGSRQKVANYAGVTVERKEGLLTTPSGQRVRVLDLPGAYSLNALSADEAVTRDVVTGQRAGEAAPDLLVCVVDATNLQLGLRMVLETQAMGIAMASGKYVGTAYGSNEVSFIGYEPGNYYIYLYDKNTKQLIGVLDDFILDQNRKWLVRLNRRNKV